MIDPMLNNQNITTLNINNFLINVGKRARKEAVEQASAGSSIVEGRKIFERNLGVIQSLVNEADLSSINVQFLNNRDGTWSAGIWRKSF